MESRPAEAQDIDALAAIWHEGWHDAHADVLPAELVAQRTLESFGPRIAEALADVSVIGPPGAPVGFCILKGSELYQLYVARPARGSGVAAALIADAEARLAARGVGTAWLSCAIGNARAARFYEKRGWQRTGTMVYPSETAHGTFPVEVWRYEKALIGSADDAGS